LSTYWGFCFCRSHCEELWTWITKFGGRPGALIFRVVWAHRCEMASPMSPIVQLLLRPTSWDWSTHTGFGQNQQSIWHKKRVYFLHFSFHSMFMCVWCTCVSAGAYVNMCLWWWVDNFQELFPSPIFHRLFRANVIAGHVKQGPLALTYLGNSRRDIG